MSSDRSREALGRFHDFLGEKGLMTPATAHTRKISALKLLSILDQEEAADVTKIDVDDVVSRFSNIHGQKYNPDSVITYRSRLRSAMTDFRSYLENPLSFKSHVQSREHGTRPRKESNEAQKGAVDTLKTDPPRYTPPMMANSTVMPIPIRADLTILIHGLPHDLSEAEARKISGVITALAVTA